MLALPGGWSATCTGTAHAGSGGGALGRCNAILRATGIGVTGGVVAVAVGVGGSPVGVRPNSACVRLEPEPKWKPQRHRGPEAQCQGYEPKHDPGEWSEVSLFVHDASIPCARVAVNRISGGGVVQSFASSPPSALLLAVEGADRQERGEHPTHAPPPVLTTAAVSVVRRGGRG